MLGDFFTYVASEVSVIADAPLIFAMAVLASATVVWWLVNLRFGGIIDSQRERLQARDEKIADYKAKLEGAEPDEARAHIKELEARLAVLEPRDLSSEEQQVIVAKLRGSVGRVHFLIDDSANRRFASQLANAFTEVGWIARIDSVFGFFEATPSGIAVEVGDPSSLTPVQNAVVFALNAVGLHPQIICYPPRDRSNLDDIYIQITQIV